jgi:pimeloyl-ACP methyl ester carboxylesterase
MSRHLFRSFSARPLDPEVVALADAMLRNREISEAAALLCRRMVLPELGRIMRGAYRNERFTLPSLFVFGTEDVGFPPRVTRKVFADAKAFGVDARLALIEGAGHYVVDEQPDATATLIVEFFASV